MNNIGKLNSSRSRIFCLLFSTVFVIFTNSNAFTQKHSKKIKVSQFEIESSLATLYDNNILKYSDKYLERFRNREDEGRFHIKTYDDIVLVPSLEVFSSFNVLKNLKSKINAAFTHRLFLNNDIKSWDYISFGFQQYVTKRAYFKFSCNYLPHFYVRHFRDRQWVAVYGYTPETFQPFSFRKKEYEFLVQNTFCINTRVRLTLAKSSCFHNKHFTEYDCRNSSYGITLYQPLHEKVKIEAAYEFATSKAKGYDASYETKVTSKGPDASYKEDDFNLLINWKLPFLFKHEQDVEAECGYSIRYYSSKFPMEWDEEHAGRVDKNLRLSLTYSVNLQKQLKISGFYNWLNRDSYTSAKENQMYLSDEKNYNQSLVGLKITYKLKI
ncbi:MAG: hypothetical protein NTU44_16225 [Bacteroidetes bacterium]|nr:hypothetical protein [Bacteroidota bacterium]